MVGWANVLIAPCAVDLGGSMQHIKFIAVAFNVGVLVTVRHRAGANSPVA